MTDVNFKYILKSNYDVQITGTVEIPQNEDASDEEFEIIFEKDDGTTTPNLFIHHYGVGITGRTEEQDYEIDTLKRIFTEDFLFFQRICDNAEKDEILNLGEAYLVTNNVDFETARILIKGGIYG